jgi:hypothetical protein
MLKKSIFLAVLLTLSSFLTFAQQQSSGNSNASATCAVTYSSGKGANATQFCITANGNIAQFSVGGSQLIQAGSTGGEGYGFCVPDAYPGGSGYDYAYKDSGNWGTPTLTQSGNTVTITRYTSDNNWKLKQTIVNIPASGTGPGSAKVTMALTNYNGVSNYGQMLRYANVDAGGAASNDFDYTSQTAYGLAPNLGRGLSGTNNTFNASFYQAPYTQKVPGGPDPCMNFQANIAPQPFVGSGSIVQFWAFTSRAGGTVTVSMTYKPI